MNKDFDDFLLFYCLILSRLLDTSPALLPCSMHFSPLLCASAVCLSLTCTLPAAYIHYFSPPLLHTFAIYLSALLLCVFTAAPLPQYMHPSCISLCFCYAWAFSQPLLQAFMDTFLCLPSCPLLLFQSPFVHPLALLIFILFFFPPFDTPVSSLTLSAPSFSQPPLYHFSSSSLWSVLVNWFYRKNVLLLFAGVCKPTLQTIQHYVKYNGSPLNLQKSPCLLQHRNSPRTHYLSFFVILLHYWAYFHARHSSQGIPVYICQVFICKRAVTVLIQINCCALGQDKINICANHYRITGNIWKILVVCCIYESVLTNA